MSLIGDIENLPEKPGVYLIKDEKGLVIYVGKAKNLKHRVKQHFIADEIKEIKIQNIGNRVDYVETRNETEALLLERKMIKQLEPRFNYKQKDDKSSLVIKITMEETYPRLLIEREGESKTSGSVYFGPYLSDSMLRETVKIILKFFPISNCRTPVNKIKQSNRRIRCMRYKLGRCLAPCINKVNKEKYDQVVDNVIQFLSGNVGRLLDNLEEEMWRASNDNNFEHAAKLRDLIRAVKVTLNIEKDLKLPYNDIDVLGCVQDNDLFSFCRIVIKNQRINKINSFIIPLTKSDLVIKISQLISIIYAKSDLPDLLLVKHDLLTILNNDTSIPIIHPTDENSKDLVEVAEKNAKKEIRKYHRFFIYKKNMEAVAKDMKLLLKLKKEPTIINGFDISTLAGSHSVGSCVVFVDGEPRKSFYRRFRIKGNYDHPDDYRMMEQVIRRRYTSDSLKNDLMPDLIIIDGGKGQLNSAKGVLEQLKLEIAVISIAKKKEEVFVTWTNEPLNFPKGSPVLRLIQHVRDEAHRFAINYHKTLRLLSKKKSVFESIKGIGKKKSFMLFKHFEDIKSIAEASPEKIMVLLKIDEQIANEVIEKAKNHQNFSIYD